MELLPALHVSWVGGSLGPCPAFWPREPRFQAGRGPPTQALVLVCRSAGGGPGAPTGLPPTSGSKLGSKMTQGRVQSCPPSALLPLILPI